MTPIPHAARQRTRIHAHAYNRRRRAALIAIKVTHSLIYFTLEFCVGYLLYTGLRKQQSSKTAIAAIAVAAESLIFFANGRRCPLTGLAEELGAERGSVTDIYLPRWLASRIFTIHLPLVLLAAYLHIRIWWREGHTCLLRTT